MTTLRNRAAFLASILLFVPAKARPASQSRAEDIQWGPCLFNGTLDITCGNVSVPMDYTNETALGNLTLQLVKVPAVQNPARGSLFVNPGGPGKEAQQWLAGSAAKLRNLTGGTYDLLAFDPRGTGTSIPFSPLGNKANTTERGERGPMMIGNSSDTALGEIWANTQLYADAIQLKMGDTTGSLVGTAFVARDFIRAVDALREDGLLRFLGFSYGTVLGMTIAAMFPERIDRMVLDGNVNPHEYYHGVEIQSFADTDKTLRRFTTECVASPAHCDLAKENITSTELETKVYAMIDKLKYNPAVFNESVIDYGQVKKSLIFDNLYKPARWSRMATTLAGMLVGNFTAAYADLNAPGSSSNRPSTPHALHGIRCGDKDTRYASLDELRPALKALFAQSRLVGELGAVINSMCAQWRLEARERYAGAFVAQTRHPILFVGNALDPVTPLASARNASAGFDGSVVLEHMGVGHTSQAQPSNCTDAWIKNYLETGRLPTPGTVCAVQGKVFRPSKAQTNGTVRSAPSRGWISENAW